MEKIKTSGPYRVEYHHGFYVVGHGKMIPVKSMDDGNILCNNLRKEIENAKKAKIRAAYTGIDREAGKEG